MKQPQPEVGEYDIQFTQVDAHVEGFEMVKKP